MTAPVPHYERREVNGAFTTVEVDLEPGRTAFVPIRTELLGTPEGDAAIRLVLKDRATLKDQLRDFS